MNTRSFLLSAALGFSAILPSVAKQRTVSNNPAIPAQYTDISPAIAASSAGDTVLIAGSLNYYGFVHIVKKVTLIGNGGSVVGNNLSTIVTGISLDSTTSTAQGDGVHIIGLRVDNFTLSSGINDALIERCVIGTINIESVPANPIRNLIVRNNIIDQITRTYALVSRQVNTLISNNFISGEIDYVSGATISNNIFSSGLSGYLPPNGVSNSLIINNIFYGGTGPLGAGNCVMSNNLTYSTQQNAIPFGTNSGSGNKVNVDPKFISTIALGAGFYTNLNYSLQATSPAKNAGTDGKDIGPTGGLYPISPAKAEQSPTPTVTQLSVSNLQILSTGTLTVQVKAKKRD